MAGKKPSRVAKHSAVPNWLPEDIDVDIDDDEAINKVTDNPQSEDAGKDKDGDGIVDNYRDKSRDGDKDSDRDEPVPKSISGNGARDRGEGQKQDNNPDKPRVNLQADYVDPAILNEIKKKLRHSTTYKKRRTHEEKYKKLSVRVYKHLHDLFYEEAAARGGHGAVQDLANEILTFWYKNKHKL